MGTDCINIFCRGYGFFERTGHQIFIADSTRRALQREVADLELVGEYEVRGRSQGITVWTLPAFTRTGSGNDEKGGSEQEENVEGLVDRHPQT